jgi:DUF917 family protein
MSLEIGGNNAIQPLMAAAHLGLPVVDADTMGRAYPEAQMTSVAVGDLKPYPCALYDPRGIEAVVTKVPSWKWMERASRKICVEMGSIASTCKAPRTGREVKDWGIHFTVSKAIGIGRRVLEARRLHADPISAILDETGGKTLFLGKIVDVTRRATEGFLRGRAVIDGLDEDRGARLEIEFQNEWVVAWRDGLPLAMSPDLICVLDTVSGDAFGTETVRYGMRVTVVALPAPPVFLTPKGLQHVGPRAFGYDLDFRRGATFMLEGGHEYDGRPFMPFDETGMRAAARQIRESGIRSVAVASVFSPLDPSHEERAGAILAEECPEAAVTLSHRLGRIGLLERENAALLNAALIELAARTIAGFRDAVAASRIAAPLYLTQNDGTVMSAETAIALPIMSFASGATN